MSPVANINMSSLIQQRRIVDQLRRESQIKRIQVSAAIEDLKVKFDFYFSLYFKLNFSSFFHSEMHYGERIRRLSPDWILLSKSESIQREKLL